MSRFVRGRIMILRKYINSDCEQLAKLFFKTVHSVNAKDYTKEQLDVWATGKVDLKDWDKSFMEHYTVVAIENNKIVGFGDIDKTGYLDRLYVHANYQEKVLQLLFVINWSKLFKEILLLTLLLRRSLF